MPHRSQAAESAAGVPLRSPAVKSAAGANRRSPAVKSSSGEPGTPHEADRSRLDLAEDIGPRLTLAEFVEREASAYRDRGTTAADFLARHLDRLAERVRWTLATTPEEHDARMEVWEGEHRRHWEAIGYDEGRRVGCRCGEPRYH